MSVYGFGKGFFRFWFHGLNRVIIKGAENEIGEGAVILYGNHKSIADVFLWAITFRREIRFMAKKSLFETPVVRRFVKKLGAFPVDREHPDLGAVKNALRVLKNGEVLGIFPEGTRIIREKTSDPKGGVAMLAWKTGAKLIPVHINYRRRVNLFNHIEVTVGAPIDPKTLPITAGTSEEFKAAGEDLIARVYAL